MTRVTMTKDLAAKIAAAYAESGFGSKSNALIAAGLTPEYAKSGPGYKAFGSKMVQEAIKAVIDGSPGASEIDLDSIIEGLSAMAYPKDGDSVTDANKLYAMDKLAKIRNCYKDGKADNERELEIRERMSAEEIDCHSFWARMRTDELSSERTPEQEEAYRLSREPEARQLYRKLEAAIGIEEANSVLCETEPKSSKQAEREMI